MGKTVLLVFVALAAACAEDLPPPATPLAAPVAVPPSAPAALAPAVKLEVQAAVTAWVDAQNQGDANAYFALYNAATFAGVKRTRAGAEKRFDFAEWKTDREKMFMNKLEVAAEAPQITTWLDDATLDPSTTTVKITQRWRSGRYSDHGAKVLRFKRSVDGKELIIGEEMLNSTPGWDEAGGAPDVKQLDGTALKSPVTVGLAWIDAQGKPTLQLTVSGAGKGAVVAQIIQFADEVSGGPGWYNLTQGPVHPSSQGPILFDAGVFWAGSGDHWRVVQDGEGIVVKDRTEDEQVAPEPGDETYYNDQIRIKLAPGVKVIAAGAPKAAKAAKAPKAPKAPNAKAGHGK